MAKTNNLDSTKIAMEAASMKETKKVSKNYMKGVTQANAKHISLKKFPKFLADAIKDGTPENLSDFIIKAAYERAEREGLI